jgi:hypothetical protein
VGALEGVCIFGFVVAVPCGDGDTGDIVGLAEEAADSTEKGGGLVSIGGRVGVDCEVGDDGGDAETQAWQSEPGQPGSV